MTMNIWTKSLLAPAMLAATVIAPTVLAPTAASANEGLVAAGDVSQDSGNMAQVTSVSQLSDVKPTDWAFQALQSLVERYGCIVGYPDRTYRGNRALTRYEFAAGLNSCMDKVNELIAAATADLAKKEDLETLKKLQEEFAAELATLRGRVDALDGKVATLEQQQFSTTTKLKGEVIYSVAGVLGDRQANAAGTSTTGLDKNTTFAYRARLGLSTSFNGKDQLFTRLQARNIPNLQAATGTNMAKLSYEGGGTSGGGVDVDKLYYRFNLNDKVRFTVDATGAEVYNNIDNFNPGLASDSTGAISRFGRFNPIYRYGSGGAGVTANVKLSDNLTIDAAYLAPNPSNPVAGNGSEGSNAVLAQIGFKPAKDVGLGFTYVRGYNNTTSALSLTGGTGSGFASQPFGAVKTLSDNFGVEGTVRINPNINLAGWAGLTKAYQIGATGDATVWNWSVAASFPDLGKKGNMAGIIFGMPPKATQNSVVATRKDASTSYHLETLYRYQLNDKVSITPGLIVLFNPEGNTKNSTTYVGTIRTTFSF